MKEVHIKTILLPTDFSHRAGRARDYAIELAKTQDAQIVLFHACEVPAFLAIYGLAAAEVNLHESAVEAAKKELGQREEELKAAGVEARWVLGAGVPHTEIVNAGIREGADLIVMATHGHGAVSHVLLGSTSEKVAHNADCPVLLVREPSDGK